MLLINSNPFPPKVIVFQRKFPTILEALVQANYTEKVMLYLIYFRSSLGLHSKPLGIVNVFNYYDGILDWVCFIIIPLTMATRELPNCVLYSSWIYNYTIIQ